MHVFLCNAMKGLEKRREENHRMRQVENHSHLLLNQDLSTFPFKTFIIREKKRFCNKQYFKYLRHLCHLHDDYRTTTLQNHHLKLKLSVTTSSSVGPIVPIY